MSVQVDDLHQISFALSKSYDVLARIHVTREVPLLGT